MKQKLLSILVLLSLCVTGAWAVGKTESFKNWGDYEQEEVQDWVYTNTVAGTYFNIIQTSTTDDLGADAIDEDGITAMHGVKIKSKNSEWITKVTLLCPYKAGSLIDEQITISSGSFEVIRDNSKTWIIITGINSSEVTFTVANDQPHFKQIDINYFDAQPYLVNTNANLVSMVGEKANKNVIPYHTRMYKKNVATTLCLPFAIAEYTSGQLYELKDIAFDEEISEWVATMEEANQADLSTTAHKPYLFMPSQDGEVSFYGEETTVLSSVDDYYTAIGTAYSKVHNDDNNQWVMMGTYQRFDWAEGNIYGFASAFHGAEEIDFSGLTVEAGDFVKAKEGAYWPEFRAFLKYEPALASRGGVPAEAPQRVIVRLVKGDGSMTKLDAVKMEENGKVWYDLQGRSYNSKPTKAGIYVNNGKKQIVK